VTYDKPLQHTAKLRAAKGRSKQSFMQRVLRAWMPELRAIRPETKANNENEQKGEGQPE